MRYGRRRVRRRTRKSSIFRLKSKDLKENSPIAIFWPWRASYLTSRKSRKKKQIKFMNWKFNLRRKNRRFWEPTARQGKFDDLWDPILNYDNIFQWIFINKSTTNPTAKSTTIPFPTPTIAPPTTASQNPTATITPTSIMSTNEPQSLKDLQDST